MLFNSYSFIFAFLPVVFVGAFLLGRYSHRLAALWLGLARNATVVSAHHHTAQAGRLEQHTLEADILVVAAGVPHFVRGEMVKPGAIVIEVGINPLDDPETGRVRMVGDVHTESVAEVAEAVSPVPGGVGPITDVTLLANTVLAARLQARRHED